MTSSVPFFVSTYGSGATGGGGPASFDLPLNDAGAGIVNLVPTNSQGSGTPTFTRATTAYTRLSTGLFALIASGSPRSIYSAAGIYLGYQAEGARANVLGGTDVIVRTMSDAGWVAGATMTKGTATGVDGTAGIAASMTGGAVEATNTVLFTTVLAQANRVFSAWVRRKTGTGTVSISPDGVVWTTITLTTAYQQFQIVTGNIANPVVGFRITTNADAIEIDFNTIEVATFANPTPIPVNVSKAADLLTYASAGNINTATGTHFAQISSIWSTDPTNSQALATDTGRLIWGGGGASTAFLIRDAAGNLKSSGAGTSYQNAVRKATASWGGAGLNAGLEGGSIASYGTFGGSIGATTLIAIGTDGGSANPWWGAVKNVKIWQTQLSAAAMAALIA